MSQNDEMVDAANAHLQKVYERERAGEIAALRDHFAGQALAGFIANPGGPFQANGMSGWGIVNCRPSDIALSSYELADAMIAARKVGAA